MKYLSDRYVAIYIHQGFRICTLKAAVPVDGDSLDYVIDHEAFVGQEFIALQDAADAIDNYVLDLYSAETPAAGTAGESKNK